MKISSKIRTTKAFWSTIWCSNKLQDLSWDHRNFYITSIWFKCWDELDQISPDRWSIAINIWWPKWDTGRYRKASLTTRDWMVEDEDKCLIWIEFISECFRINYRLLLPYSSVFIQRRKKILRDNKAKHKVQIVSWIWLLEKR